MDNLNYTITFDLREILHPIEAKLHTLFKHTVYKNGSIKKKPIGP